METRDDENEYLTYQNYLTGERRYEISYNKETGTIDFGDSVPEFWKKLQELCKSNKDGFRRRGWLNISMYAIVVAEYPEFQEFFEFDASIGQIKFYEDNPIYNMILNHLSVKESEDGAIDLIGEVVPKEKEADTQLNIEQQKQRIIRLRQLRKEFSLSELIAQREQMQEGKNIR